jgi:uncharacterized protein
MSEDCMHYVIHCLDKKDALQTRLDHYEAHKAYLAEAEVKTVVSGPLVADDGQTMIGSFFLVEAPSKEAVVAFNANDPFAAAGVGNESTSIHS